MSEALFGPPAGLLRRLHRGEVRTGDVRAAVDRVDVAGLGADLQLTVAEGGRGPVLVLEEAGRRTRVLLAELAVEMTRAHVPATPEGIGAALAVWLGRRPVPDLVAADSGVAVLDWADARQTTLGWRVVVVRGDLVVPWRPSRDATLPAVHDTRVRALDRAADVTATLQVQGPVGLWTSDVPGLDSAALVRPEALLAEMARCGLRLRDAHVVVTPRRPVAWAEPPAARRLGAEATGACRTVPWRRLDDLGWA